MTSLSARRTHDHVRSVQHIFKKLYDKGDIYKGHYEGWYCSPCESFFTETQVVDGKCPDCGASVSRAQEEAYFFKMSNYADKLMQYIEAHPEFIEPEARKKEMVNNFLKAGLQDLCVSRSSFKWGIPITFDEKHVTYVWIDALSNYITALGYDPDNAEQPELFNKFWPADVHIIGKDILRFHTIYWPIILMALDIPLPKRCSGIRGSTSARTRCPSPRAMSSMRTSLRRLSAWTACGTMRLPKCRTRPTA